MTKKRKTEIVKPMSYDMATMLAEIITGEADTDEDDGADVNYDKLLIRIRGVEAVAKAITGDARQQEVRLKVAKHLGLEGTEVPRMNWK